MREATTYVLALSEREMAAVLAGIVALTYIDPDERWDLLKGTDEDPGSGAPPLAIEELDSLYEQLRTSPTEPTATIVFP